MLNLIINKEEYIQIGQDIKILLKWTGINKAYIAVDAPREVPVFRSEVIKKRATSELAAKGDPDSIAVKNELKERDAKYSKMIENESQKRHANMEKARAKKRVETQTTQAAEK